MAFDSTKSVAFIKSINLDAVPLYANVAIAQKLEPDEVFDKAKAQSQLVGSTVFSFAQGVDTAVREAISDSALLAQLVANSNAAQEEDPLKWFKLYSDVLMHLGWVLQEAQFTDYTNKGNAVEVHEKILEVMTVALGPSAAALAIVTATINALKGMKSDSSWLTIFNRESQKARIARFQIGLVETGADSDVFVSLMCCLIEANDTITQVLLFKFRSASASFKAQTQKVSINRAALSDLGPSIRKKVRNYQDSYLSSILNV